MGLKKNIIYSSILTTSNYVFPLIVYPYVSRVLGVTNIGICNFVDSIIHYFILFSMMGVTVVGTREVAASRMNIKELNAKYTSILTLNGITTLIALIALIISTFFVAQLRENKEMMVYGGIKLVSNFFLIEWFYKGIESFRFIMIRTIIVKLLFVVSVFLFVKHRKDFSIYYLLTCLMVTGNAIINTAHAGKYVKFIVKSINIKSIIRPFFTLGSYMLITSMCTTFNVAYLGFITNDTQVGYYTTATKLYSILLALFTGITTVIMPRMSSLLANNKMDEFKDILKKSTDILFTFSIPVIIFTIIFARQIILLIAGSGYEGAIIPMQIVMPLMIIIGYEQIIVIQGLMPLRKDKAVMINASIGAIVSIILNIILVYPLQSVGSSIVWICSESVILLLSQRSLSKYYDILFPFSPLFKSILSYIPLFLILLIYYYISEDISYWIRIFLGGIIMISYVYILQVFICKNPLVIKILSSLLYKI